MAQPPLYLQLIYHIITDYLMKELVYFMVLTMGEYIIGAPIKAI